MVIGTLITIRYQLSIMVGKLIHIRMQPTVMKELKKISSEGYFSSVNDTIRDFVRRGIFEYRKQQGLAYLKRTKGILKGKGGKEQLSEEERAALAEEFFSRKDADLEILREFGLEHLNRK